MLRHQIKRIIMIAATSLLLLTGCATGPTVRSDAAANTNFSAYKSFGFMEKQPTDNADYTTLVTQHFKDAISAEMSALGYQYTETNPELLVIFNSNVETRTDVRSTPTVSVQYGYYNYRHGIYAGFPLYANDIDTVRYKYGTVNIDVVDAAKKQLVWEGIAEGTLKRTDLDEPKQAIANVVQLIFQQYPTRQQTP